MAVAPSELEVDESLRDRLRDGRFLALAALVQFVRAVIDGAVVHTPPLRACFLFDDPNLHWPSYGHLRYADLVSHADRYDYHVAFATVPLDGWFVHPSAARLFRRRGDRVSLIVHGNNHTRLELARPDGAGARTALLAQALRRVAAFERRSGVPVARIMAAPHGVCSEEMAKDLVPLGFEGLCISRPYPWLARPPRSWLARPAESSALAGWDPASVVAGGLPVFLRRGFADPHEDLAFRAFLDQPLIIYGHHDDMSDGLDLLAELARRVRRLGDVEWMSIGDIAASNVRTVRDGRAMEIEMFSRRGRVNVPAGVEEVVVRVPTLEPGEVEHLIRWTSESHDTGLSQRQGVARTDAQPMRLPDATRHLNVHLLSSARSGQAKVERPAFSPWAVARRVMGETRDRVTPAYRRARSTSVKRGSGAGTEAGAGARRGERSAGTAHLPRAVPTAMRPGDTRT